MAGNATVFQPDPERHAIYQQFYTLYRELSAELTPRFARLEALRSQYGEDNDHNLRILWSRC
jgi:hypothetical protein